MVIGARLRVHLFHQAAHAAPLPVLHLLLLALRNVLLLHDDHGGCVQAHAVAVRGSAHQHAVSGLQIAQLDCGGGFQIGLAGSQAEEPRAGLNLHRHLRPLVRRQR